MGLLVSEEPSLVKSLFYRAYRWPPHSFNINLWGYDGVGA